MNELLGAMEPRNNERPARLPKELPEAAYPNACAPQTGPAAESVAGESLVETLPAQVM